jgi:hypothetical protein
MDAASLDTQPAARPAPTQPPTSLPWPSTHSFATICTRSPRLGPRGSGSRVSPPVAGTRTALPLDAVLRVLNGSDHRDLRSNPGRPPGPRPPRRPGDGATSRRASRIGTGAGLLLSSIWIPERSWPVEHPLADDRTAEVGEREVQIGSTSQRIRSRRKLCSQRTCAPRPTARGPSLIRARPRGGRSGACGRGIAVRGGTCRGHRRERRSPAPAADVAAPVCRDRRDAVDQRQELGDVVGVAAGQRDRQRNAAGVDLEVTLSIARPLLASESCAGERQTRCLARALGQLDASDRGVVGALRSNWGASQWVTVVG